MHLSRRHFLQSAAGAALFAGTGAAVQAPPARPSVCVFSKHLQFLDYKGLAAACREIGADGVDLTVRPGGHVLPENVARDLPAAAEAIRAEGLELAMITTRLAGGADAEAQAILSAAAALKIPYFRIGNHRYREDADLLTQLAEFTASVRELIELADRHGITAGYHNHSGMNNVGAPLWDLHWMYTQIASPRLGSNFDVGHARVEGAFGAWEINARLLAAHTKMMSVKDFVWDGARPRWVPLGEGIVPLTEFLKIFKAADFSGPISIHVEYDVPSEDAMIGEMRAAVTTVRAALEAAGY